MANIHRLASSRSETLVKTTAVMDEKDFTPRDYQVELYNAATKGNTIIFLQTGAGKTFIAVLMIRDRARDITKPLNEGGRRCIFLVPTVVLGQQQSRYIQRHVDLKVSLYHGALGVDLWKRDRWQKEFEENHVLVMTSQIFSDILDHSYFQMSQVSLLIIDECHGAVKDSPMAQVLLKLDQCDETEHQPRILGLTAALFRKKCPPNKVDKYIEELERNMRSRIRTASNVTTTSQYSAKPKLMVVDHALAHEDPKARETFEKLEKALASLIAAGKTTASTFVVGKNPKDFQDRIKEPEEVFRELEQLLRIFGPWGVDHGAKLFSVALERRRLRSVDPSFKKLLENVRETLANINRVFECVSTNLSSQEALKILTTPNLERLLEILRNNQKFCVNNGDSMCCLIFVERRSTANVLHHYLKAASKVYPDLSFVRPLFTMGQAGNPKFDINEQRELDLKQRDVIDRFHDGRANVLVSTSVLEEGIDVRACNLVIRFDGLRTYCDYVQAKGRARAPRAHYVIMFDEGNRDGRDLLRQFILIEMNLTQKYGTSVDYGDDDDEDSDFESENERVPPYRPFGKTGPRITMSNAISVINRYCSSLPSDRFSPLAPEWTVHQLYANSQQQQVALSSIQDDWCEDGPDLPTGYQCSLLLPLNSPLREEVLGLAMPNKRSAKQAAAYVACVRLHQLGELSDEHLLPLAKDVQLQHEDDVLFEEEHVGPEDPIPGTRKRCQDYTKSIAPELTSSEPLPGRPCFVYEFKIRRNSDNSVLFPAQSFGIVTRKPIPAVCDFPLYTRMGNLWVNVSCILQHQVLNEDQISRARLFHRYIFEKLLQVTDEKIVYDPAKAPADFLIVPLDRTSSSIDFQTVDDALHAKKPDFSLQSVAIRKLQKVDFSQYSDAVVAALHRHPIELFFVNEVTTLTPLSRFPSEEHPNYAHYYATRNGVRVEDFTQPLLKVSRVKTNATFLTPRADKLRDKREIHLIPELCAVLPFPGVLWRQALLLPAMLYRLNRLLLAERLRQCLATEVALGSTAFVDGFHKWPQAEVVQSLGSLQKRHVAENPLQDGGIAGSDSDSLRRALGPAFHARGDVAEAVDGSASSVSLSGNLIDVDWWTLELNDPPVEKSSPPENNDEFMEDLTELRRLAEEISFSPARISFDHQPEDSAIGPSCGLILQALTAISSNEDVNLERLEIVGDSFLKLAVSVYLYVQRSKNLSEGYLTALRIRKICNRTLYYLGKKIGLPSLIRTEIFAPKTNWLPPGYTATSEESPRALQKRVSDKSIADSMEALIGTYLLTTGTSGALRFIEWAGIRVIPNDGITNVNGFVGPMDSPVIGCVPNEEQVLQELTTGLEKFEERIGYTFKEKAYLLQALSHASYTQNRLTGCYERLEFLGDALLDYLVTRHIYEGPIKHSPGALTDLRSALVNNATFACLAVRNGFHCFLKHMSQTLVRAVDVFVSKQERNGHQVLDDYLLIESDTEAQEFAAGFEVPKVLGDIFESVAGAIFLDSGMSMDAVWRVYYPLMYQEIEEFSKCVPQSPVRELYEMHPGRVRFQKAKVLDDGRVSITVDVQDKGSFQGVGLNSLIAKCTAAKFALKRLKSRI